MMNPALLIAIPLLLAFLSLIFKKLNKQMLVLSAFLNLSLLLAMDKGQYIIGGFKPPYGINLILDDYAMVAGLVVNGLVLLIALMSYEKISQYGTVLLVALAGMNGMIMTGDLFNLFVFLEITSITAYILAGASRRVHHAFNYLVLGTVGSGFLLFGIVLLYAVFGSLNMADLSMKMGETSLNQLILPSFFIFMGIAVEAKILPFNGWVKGVYGNANALTGALFASAYAATLLFVFGRLFGQVILMSGYLKVVLIILGMLTLIAGETAALSKTRVREILLYSSIGQSGLIMTLFVSGLIFPATLQLINNVLTKSVLFTIGGKISDEAGTDEKEQLQGIFLNNQIAGVCFTAATLSLIGLPLFFGFFSKINLMLGLFNQGNFAIPAVVLLATVIEGAYFIRLLVKLWTPGEEGDVSSKEAATEYKVRFGSVQLIALAIITLSLVAGGMLPGIVQNNLASSGQLLDEATPGYLFDSEGGF